jgi:tRNA(fMet)-specific endonuclease VapC
MTVLPVTSEVARGRGALRAWLEARGRPIGLADTFVAAHAQLLSLTSVTNNTRHLGRVPGLALEDWA